MPISMTNTPEVIDLLIEARWVATVESDTVLKNHAVAIDKGRITHHIIPLLGSCIVRDLSPQDVTKLFRDVKAGKTAADVKTGIRGRAVVTGGPATAKRVVGLLQGILSFAVAEGIIEKNPAHGISLPSDAKRKVADVPEKLAALGQARGTAQEPFVIDDDDDDDAAVDLNADSKAGAR